MMGVPRRLGAAETGRSWAGARLAGAVSEAWTADRKSTRSRRSALFG